MQGCTNAYASPNSLTMVEALPYFEGRSRILARNVRQGKRFFCVLVCCTSSCWFECVEAFLAVLSPTNIFLSYAVGQQLVGDKSVTVLEILQQ